METKTKLSHENTESYTVRSATAGNPLKHNKDEDSEDSEEYERTHPKVKRNPATNCHNQSFSQSLQRRKTSFS